MRYFSVFPKVYYTDENRNTTVYTNILSRVNIISELMDNPALYYTYTMQDGDSPEIISSKYYGTPYRYWIFLFGNDILDPQYDVGLSVRDFDAYMKDKYGDDYDYTKVQVQQYYKNITTIDSTNDTTTVDAIPIDQETWENTPAGVTTTVGNITQTIDRSYESVYDYEVRINNEKRDVRLVSEKYATQMEYTLQDLLK